MNVIEECRVALSGLDWSQVDATVEALGKAKLLFCVGNGGGYAHAMHFASDLRKIVGKQAFSFDNAAEMTARINDDGWEYAWRDWRVSYGEYVGDFQFMFSVGGARDGLSPNLAKACVASWYGIVGEKGGYGDRIVIPSTSTPVVEGCQSVIAHHLVEQLCG